MAWSITDAKLDEAVVQLFSASGYSEQTLTELRDCGNVEVQKAARVDAGAGAQAALTYGEVLKPMALFRALGLTAKDVFYDLGSGRGQLVLAACMAFGAESGDQTLSEDHAGLRSVGVELLHHRHVVAVAAQRAAPLDIAGRCTFECGDAAAADLSEATKVWLCNVVFPDSLNLACAAALRPQRAPKLEGLATARALPREAAAEASLELQGVVRVEASWASDGAAVFLYGRGLASHIDSDAAYDSMLENMIHGALGDEFLDP